MSLNSELLEYYKDEFCGGVWQGKYALSGERTPKDMHTRLSLPLASVEDKYQLQVKESKDISDLGKKYHNLTMEDIFKLLDRYKYIIPQGSIMSMLGNYHVVGSLSNCFVIPPPIDSYGGIFETDQQIAQLEKRRGGVGTNLNTLRPEASIVNNAAATSTGAHSFMDRYSNTTREVAQNGRRGALMLLMHVRHPDIFKFVGKKKDRTKVTGANISVQLTDEFMEAVIKDEDFYCRFPIDKSSPYITPDIPYNELYTLATDEESYKVMRIKAKELYDLIVENAWENAEPGLAFMDNIVDYSPEGCYEEYKPIASNPCGEQWMQAHDACRLLAMNLYSMVKNPWTKDASIDYNKVYEIAYLQQRLGDNIVDLEITHIDRIIQKIKKDPEPDNIKLTELNLWNNIRTTAENSRRTGCGFTALADMLAAINLPYDSDEALEVIKKVMQAKMRGELDSTIDMAIMRGPFKGWDPSIEKNRFYDMIKEDFPEQYERMNKYGRRNCSWSTVAPTGTVSIVALLDNYPNTSAGIEPQFATHYYRNKKVNPGDTNVRVDFIDQNGDSWMTFPVIMGGFKEWISRHHKEASFIGIDNLPKEVIEELFKKSPYFGSCANDISWSKRLKIQSIVQRYTTNAISSTLNLPNSVDKATIGSIYQEAWKLGLKGVTVYRDGCRTGVLNLDKKSTFEYKDAVKRPKDVKCEIFTTTAKGKKWNVIVGTIDSKPYEVFAIPHFTNETEMTLRKINKGRYDLIKDNETFSEDITSEMNDEEEVVTRMISTALRHGTSPEFIIEQLDKSHGTVVSFSKAISRNLSKFVKKSEVKGESCPECGGDLRKEEGCTKCTNIECGYSKC